MRVRSTLNWSQSNNISCYYLSYTTNGTVKICREITMQAKYTKVKCAATAATF